MSEVSPTQLLTPLEAAHYLGITPELLFAYTRNRFRKSGTETRRLATQDVGGATRFSRAELDDFDCYLKEPWADAGTGRVDPQKCIQDHLRAESGNQCVRCGSGIGVQTAHIEPWATSRSNHHRNLLRICSACHIEHDEHNSLSTEQLIALKNRAISRVRAMLEQRMAPRESQFEPPQPDPLFFGRSAEVLNLREALQVSRTILIRGPGGIGKTQLLLQALSGVDIGRRIVWISVEQYGSVNGVRSALEMLVGEDDETRGLKGTGKRLDALQACVVLDGVEQLLGPALDELDDLLFELHGLTHITQYVLTSQVDLQRTRFDDEFSLIGLEAEPSRHTLRNGVRNATGLDSPSEAGLLAFVDGHPLALQLTARLVNYYGSGRAALEQIKRRGAEMLELQKRTSHDRQTSLSTCLSLAYDALDPDEQRVCFLIANCPGGIFSLFVNGQHGISDAKSAIAGLQRWSFVLTTEVGMQTERLYMLSPIRSYTEGRWRVEHPTEASTLTNDLLISFGVMAAVIDRRADDDPAEIPYMIARYSQELPNLLRIFDAAEAQPDNADFVLIASGLCTALMNFFFIKRLPELGTQVMLRGVRIALRDRKIKRASELLVQAASLAYRNDDGNAIESVKAVLAQIEMNQRDVETKGNIALARAIIEKCHNDTIRSESHARSAVKYLESARAEFVALASDHTAEISLDNIDSFLSNSLSLLGFALLEQGNFEGARTAYKRARELLRGGSIPVNDGQILHQIGNCESNLGNHIEAARCYKEAARRFYDIGMQEYLSNALGELGNTILDINSETALPTIPESEVLIEGLRDVAIDLARCFAKPPFDLEKCASAIRKLFGIVVVVSFSEHTEYLGAFAIDLKDGIIKSAAGLCEKDDGKSDNGFALSHLDRLAALAFSIDAFERHAIGLGKAAEDDKDKLAFVCFQQGQWANIRRRSFEWLALYLRYKWGFQGVTGDDLMFSLL